MKPTGGGEIIVTSSIASLINESIVGTSYMPAKAAVNHFVRHMAMELGAYGIRVNAILPGPFITNIAGGRLRNKADRAAFESQSLIGRIGDVEDIKGLALLLASPAGVLFHRLADRHRRRRPDAHDLTHVLRPAPSRSGRPENRTIQGRRPK